MYILEDTKYNYIYIYPYMKGNTRHSLRNATMNGWTLRYSYILDVLEFKMIPPFSLFESIVKLFL